MPKSMEQLLVEIEHHQRLVDYHSGEVKRFLREYLLLQGPVPIPYSSKITGMKGNVKSLALWTEWLAENQPAYRQTITEATGVRLSEKAKPRMIMWTRLVPVNDDDAHPPDTVCYIQDKPSGKGRPQMIYFLWSQRWDVYPLFGVGPIKPDGDELQRSPEIDPADIEPETMEPLLGVIAPPIQHVTSDGIEWSDEPLPWPEPTVEVEVEVETPRHASLDAWHEAHEHLFDFLVSTESKPTEEQKEIMVKSMPDGSDSGSAIAMAYQAAVLRSRTVSPPG